MQSAESFVPVCKTVLQSVKVTVFYHFVRVEQSSERVNGGMNKLL